jgi:tetratricopeptide (TPR) repeat protein
MEPTPVSGFLAELKRRRVFRAAAVYAAVAWVVIQGAATILPILEAPPWATKVIVFVALAGLPITLGLAWLIDIRVSATSTPPSTENTTPAHARSAARPFAIAALLIIVLFTGGFFAWRRSSADAVLDANAVAVLPFRVATDPALAYLREGMVDLLATKFTGEGGPRGLDARTSIAAWKRAGSADLEPDQAIELTRELRAGQVLLGSIVGNAGNLTLTATLYDVRTGRERASADAISGPSDSLAVLVDHLVARLIAGSVESEHRLALLTSTSLPALRLYLEGTRMSRSGHYQEAARAFEQALSIDTTFALAALALGSISGIGNLTVASATLNRVLPRALNARDRLSERDQILLEALIAPADDVRAWERALQAWPDRADVLSQFAARVRSLTIRGDTTAARRSAEYFGRAVAIDSSFAYPYIALTRQAALDGDTAAITRYSRTYLRFDSTGESAHLLRWLHAASRGDLPTLERIRANMEALPDNALGWIASASLLYGLRVEDGEPALRVLEKRATTPSEHANYLYRKREVLASLGRVNEAQDVSLQLVRYRLPELPQDVVRAISNVEMTAFWQSDTTRLDPAFAAIEQYAARNGATSSLAWLAIGATLRAMEGDVSEAKSMLQTFDRRAANSPPGQTPMRDLFRSLASAAVAQAEKPDDLATALSRVDSLWSGVSTLSGSRHSRNLAQLLHARLLEMAGNRAHALAVLRRREPNDPPYFATVFYREEGRLAELTGNRQHAIKSYQKYLALRKSPDPTVQAEVQWVASQLRRLTGEAR